MERFEVKYRMAGKGSPPQPIRMKIGGWSGANAEKANGSEPQPWHCPPFIEASTYGFELAYPYETQCDVVHAGGDIRFDWDYAKEPGASLSGGEFGIFFPKPSRFYFFQTAIDVAAPAGYVLRTQPHPRFYTDETDTVPVAIGGHVQTSWWGKRLFVVFKSPRPGGRHVFRKGEPFVQVTFVPQGAAYEAVVMGEEEAARRRAFDQSIEGVAAHVARNVWHNPSGQEFKDHYKVLSRANATGGIEAVDALVAEAVKRCAAARPANLTVAQCMELADQRIAEGRLIEAREIYFHAMDREPNNAGVNARVSRLALRMGLPGVAVNMAVRAVNLQPGVAEYRRDLGTALLAEERYEEADGAFRDALTLAPDDVESQRGLSEAVERRGAVGAAR